MAAVHSDLTDFAPCCAHITCVSDPSYEMMMVLLVDNDLETYLADIFIQIGSIQSSSGRDWNIQSKRQQDKFQDQVVYQENLHHFMSTEATEKLKSLRSQLCRDVYKTTPEMRTPL